MYPNEACYTYQFCEIFSSRNAAKRIIDGRREVPRTEIDEITTIKDSGDENIDNIPPDILPLYMG